jgi:hypothetical protein
VVWSFMVVSKTRHAMGVHGGMREREKARVVGVLLGWAKGCYGCCSSGGHWLDEREGLQQCFPRFVKDMQTTLSSFPSKSKQTKGAL